MLHTSERKGIEKGMQLGIQIGAAALETACKMLAKGFNLSLISEITGLSEQQIAELARETAD